MRRILAAALLLIVLSPWAAASEALSVPARGAALIDADSGRVLFGQNENQLLPMASTTKVMTALLALESGDPGQRVTAGKNASGVPGTSLYLSEGETLTLEQLLYGLLLRSGNDAAVAIAEHVSGGVPAFVERMNARAKALGADARFSNPHGLDAEGHAASALGMALILREAMKREDFRAITATQRKVIPWVGNEYSRVLENKNRLLKTYPGILGGKTGYTGKAGRCLVFAAERNGLTLVGAVLNCPTWFDTAAALLDYGFENYRSESAAAAGAVVASVPVLNGTAASVDALTREALSVAVRADSKAETVVDLPDHIEAPVRAGDALGTLSIREDGVVVARCALLAAADVPRRSLSQSLRRLLRRWVLRFGP